MALLGGWNLWLPLSIARLARVARSPRMRELERSC
jgi:hypothetical protein